MDEVNYLIMLYDFYGDLLSDKQKEYFEDYYFNNLSLGEISENTGLSRNAIHKNIKVSEEKLKFYEEKLGLYKKRRIFEDIIKDIDDENVLNKLKNLY
ncbi:MAG: YlxM family DNA-binding protein [Bacilli bacterium]